MTAEELFGSARSGNRAALSRALTEIEYLTPVGMELLDSARDAPEPRMVGWTGAPGAGKSSLLAAILPLRRTGNRVAVLAVDPTSPLTGGSVLGDRIRMDDLVLDEAIYIRSLPTRIRQVAVAPATMRLARFLAAVGFDEVHIETVGVGQSEIEVSDYAETTVLVTGPHGGDAVQGLKAGLLEVADIYVVSKCDLAGAAKTALSLEAAVEKRSGGWTPPIVRTSAAQGIGVDELSVQLDRHLQTVEESGVRAGLFRTRRRAEFRAALLAALDEKLARQEELADLYRVERGEVDPVRAAAAWVEMLGKGRV